MNARARTAGWGRRLAARRAARSAHGRDAGGVAIEAAIVLPAVAALVLATAAAGRVQTSAGTVESAARSAARTASLARSVDGMDELVKKAALDTMRQQGVACRNWEADVKQGELVTHGAPLVTVEVTVVCEVPLNDLLPGPGMPWTKRLTGHFVSVVDRYRGG
ncbi:TadE/TadG family type IV pilus assembly protein [Kitasatospora sp. A2-31]|uniref:TadE/TadG family type IV pilus assembly protein n=1 Tax=Kitasatospora sp. A2-31 TaxID=2916414 RepID=UPI001EEB2E8C|nr:TadE/TadG family type IV pilus assembly protein [Kitasatospora sp. A2-31]MCG6496094.1 pilus assembly protein [Kitasatospora sp. A2-31]